MRICFAILIFVFVTIAVSGDVRAYPEPAIVQRPGEWTLDVVFSRLEQISVKCPGEQAPSRYWYIILTLTNKTGSDVPFYPACDLVTDTFRIVTAGKGVRRHVFEQIKLKHQGRYPFLENIDQAGNKVLEGVDNTKDIVIIWPDFDPNARNIHLFISGLSNETAIVEHPVVKDDRGRAVKVFLRKTLQLTYLVPGDAAFRSGARLSFAGKGWIMR